MLKICFILIRFDELMFPKRVIRYRIKCSSEHKKAADSRCLRADGSRSSRIRVHSKRNIQATAEFRCRARCRARLFTSAKLSG